jgi:hypothetical protein
MSIPPKRPYIRQSEHNSSFQDTNPRHSRLAPESPHARRLGFAHEGTLFVIPA